MSMTTSPLNTSMGNSNQVTFTEPNQGSNRHGGVNGNSKFISAKSNNETFGVIEEQSSGYAEFIPYDHQKEMDKIIVPRRSSKASSPTSHHQGRTSRKSLTQGQQTRQKRSSFNSAYDGVSANDES